ncbi:MAG: YceD family protein, partial [Microthrixaceae bacterium]
VVTVEIGEIFKDRTEGEAGEILPISNDSIDLGQVVHDAAILALPLAPLCRTDCAGPLPDLFPVITAENAESEPIDPRWASLGGLRFDSDPDE